MINNLRKKLELCLVELLDLYLDEDGLWSSKYNVYLNNIGLTCLPLKFGRVNGIFDVTFNKLTSLDGMPHSVGDSLYISNNELKDLKGCTQIIGGSFICTDNYLTSLEGGPISCINYNCSYNELTNLKGIATTLEGVNCINNQITSLIGLPKKLNLLRCSRNNLTSLEGAPEILTGDLYCSHNKLTTLEHLPKSVHNIYMYGNKIKLDIPSTTIYHNFYNDY